jgi:cytochrome c oxidase subunit I
VVAAWRATAPPTCAGAEGTQGGDRGRAARRTKRKGSILAYWLSSTDHKVIGHRYLITSFFFFLCAGVMALLMRIQLMGPDQQVMSDTQYNELFTMHGTIMLLLFATPLFIGFANELVPLQIGAPDVAFPRLNILSYYLFTFGGLILLGSFLAPNGAAEFGWYAYSPLTSATYSPGVGGDMWIMGLALSGVGTILSGVNFITTICCMRAPGMTMFRMPIFTWNALLTSTMVLLAFPVLAAALLVLEVDRRLGSHVFDAGSGGAILWQHLFWFFGHPEVYILALPFFGIATEIIPVFSRKPLFGYKGMVAATIAIAGLSMTVWPHHMFTTGAVLLPFFSFMTLLIAVPTGVKFFNWAGTLWHGQLTFEPPMLYSIGCLVTFLFGGITGIILASPPQDFAVSDSLLRGRPLPLRAGRHGAVRDVRRLLLLVAEDDRQDAEQPDRQTPVLGDVRRLPHDIPGTALDGCRGDAAPHRQLPLPAWERDHAQRDLHRGIVAPGPVHPDVLLEHLCELEVRGKGDRGGSVGVLQFP